jgi:chaperonin GroES
MIIRPLKDRVAVRMDKVTDLKTESGLLYLPIPEEERWSDEMKGTIIAVGPGKVSKKGVRKPLEVQVGQRIRVQRIGARESFMKDEDGNDIMLCQEADILGIIN